MRSIEWRDGNIVIIDQTALPGRLELLTLTETDAVAAAIRTLRVRGAPALGIIGAMGVAQAGYHPPAANPKTVIERAERAATILTATRPTAVNLAWATERVLAKGRAIPMTAGPLRIAQGMVDEALAIQLEDEEACTAMGKNALEFFRPKGVVLTHCNTGFLCTGGDGTALGAIKHAHEQLLGVVVIATETRPLLQGARLTTWELARLGIPHALVVDSAAPGLIARGEVSMVIVGADRIAANGDVANKVGTYPLALAADVAGIPFVVVAPTSTIDLTIADGSKIEVEERAATEVTTLASVNIAPPGTQAINPAFDITPSHLVTAIVTERGVARAPVGDSLKKMLKGRSTEKARASVRPSSARPVSARPAARARRATKPPAKKRVPVRATTKKIGKKSSPKKVAASKKARSAKKSRARRS